MADGVQREIHHLRTLVVKLVQDIDYKNHVLMQKEDLIEEKDKLLQDCKHSLHEAHTQASCNSERVKLEIVKLNRALETAKEKLGKRPRSNELKLGKTTSMKLENEKLQQDLETRSKELENLVKKQNDNVQESTNIISAENLVDLRAQLDILKNELAEKEETLQSLEMDNQTLTIKEVNSNRELQDARKAATEGLEAMKIPRQTRLLIGIKRMGEVDHRPFRDACVKRFRSGDWDEKFGNCEEKSSDLCSSWQTNLSNPAWQPFKMKLVDGKLTEVVDEEDPMLMELRKEWGDEVYEAVVEALMGVNEYNASGRYPVSELWNYKEKRKASLCEVIQYVIKLWKTHKTKKKSLTNLY